MQPVAIGFLYLFVLFFLPLTIRISINNVPLLIQTQPAIRFVPIPLQLKFPRWVLMVLGTTSGLLNIGNVTQVSPTLKT